VLAARSEDKLKELVSEITASGGSAEYVVADLARDEDSGRAVQTAQDTFGRLDVAFNNAGIGPEGVRLADGSPDVWQATLDLNLTGVARCMRYEIQAMLAGSGGAIVNNGSTAAVFGTAFSAAYSAAKHGLVGLSKTAASEYGTSGIRGERGEPRCDRHPADRAVALHARRTRAGGRVQRVEAAGSAG
jgi:NAD(P)-dependent dehydrogenase (short-subunit alcohol dehydrogenase family)